MRRSRRTPGGPAPERQARAARGARLGDHGPLRDQGRARRDGRDARARRRTSAREGTETADRRRGGRGGRSSAVSAPARASRRASELTAVVDTRALHFFDPETGLGIYDESPDERSTIVKQTVVHARRARSQWRSLALAAAAAATTSSSGEQRPRKSRRRLRQRLDRRRLDRRRAEALPGRARRLQEEVPERQGDVQVDRRQHADRALDRGAGRQPARPRRGLAAGPRERLPEEGRAQADRLRSATRCSTNYPADIAKLGEINGNLYGLIIKGANKSTVWYNVAVVQERGRQAADDVGRRSATTARRSRRQALPAYSIGGADGWTLTDLFENIYLRQAGAGRSTTS